jgi:cytidylate kinase
MAADHGLDVGAFSALAEGDPEYDLELDQRLAVRARKGSLVLESRLAGWIAVNERLPATTVWIAAEESERARRVAEREGTDVAAALAANGRRETSEKTRYRTYYGIDLDDLSIYDLVIDSTSRSPEEIAESIVAAASK